MQTPFPAPAEFLLNRNLVSQRLNDAGYQHTPTPNSDDTGKHLVTEIATGKLVGEFTAHEVVELLERRTAKLDAADLRRFTGWEHWYRHPINRNVLFTDGAKYVADEGGAYWLLDAIAICQRHEKAVADTPSF